MNQWNLRQEAGEMSCLCSLKSDFRPGLSLLMHPQLPQFRKYIPELDARKAEQERFRA